MYKMVLDWCDLLVCECDKESIVFSFKSRKIHNQAYRLEDTAKTRAFITL